MKRIERELLVSHVALVASDDFVCFLLESEKRFVKELSMNEQEQQFRLFLGSLLFS